LGTFFAVNAVSEPPLAGGDTHPREGHKRGAANHENTLQFRRCTSGMGEIGRKSVTMPPARLITAGTASAATAAGERPEAACTKPACVTSASLCADLAAGLTDAGQLDAPARLVTDNQDARALLIIGKTALQRGFPLDAYASPTIGVPEFEPLGTSIEGDDLLGLRARRAASTRAPNHTAARAALCN
jgi:soluble lytic murein transglycosylase